MIMLGGFGVEVGSLGCLPTVVPEENLSTSIMQTFSETDSSLGGD